MASVIASARTSTASLFDFVGTSATVANQLVGTAARAVDALDAKAQAMHKQVLIDTKVQMLHAEDHAILRAATDRADLLEEAHRKNTPSKEFNREEVFLKSVKEIKAALNAA